MITCFSKDLFNSIFKYNNYQDIINFSLTNKYFYSFLNPENNPYINTFFRDLSFEFFFNINNKKNYQKLSEEYFLDDFNKTKNNWKKIFQNLKTNSEKFMKKEIGEEIYKSFKTHCYMPYQRKENKILEFENSTLHQIICYDMNKNDYINMKYYDKYFNNKKEKNENNKIVPLRKGLFFEEELINFKSQINNYHNNKLMRMITNYSFQKLNNVYYSIINQKKDKKNNDVQKKNYKLNSIYLFIVYLNHTLILFIDLLFKYVYQFRNIQDPKKIIIEYTKIHSNLINFGLTINEKFNNINIIFNILHKGKTSTNSAFKIYNMFLNIMEQNFYQKLKPLLNKNIEKLINLLTTEYFEKEKMNNSFNCHSIETNNTEQKNEENNNSDDNDSYDYFLNDSICDDIDIENDDYLNNEGGFTYKKVIEEYSNSILDYCINKDNSNYINNSKIKLNEIYNEYEKLMKKNFIESIKMNLKEDKEMFLNNNVLINEGYESLCSSFSFIKSFFGKEEKGGFKLINRTKLNIFIYCINYLFNYLKKLNNNKYIYKIKSLNKKETYFLNEDNNLIINNDSEEQNIINELYANELNNNKMNLVSNNENIKDIIIEQKIEKFIINHLNLNNDKNELKNMIKDMLLFLDNQINLFKSEDKKIIDISLIIEDKNKN